MINPARKTTLEVVRKAQQVKINPEKIRKVAEEWVRKKVKVPPWPEKYHLKTNNSRKALDYLILLDALNFCFWNKNGKVWKIQYKGREYSGYFALSLVLRDFFERNSDKGNLDYFSKISFGDFKEILQGGENLQFLKKRHEISMAVSKFIIGKYVTSDNFVKSAKQNLSLLVSKIYKELPFFNDAAYCRGRKIYFLKRAQILGGDIMGFFKNKGLGYFKDPEYLTAFPDYKLPQILRHFGILEYSDKLKQKIKNKILIPKNSLAEIEIRSCTIWAVEFLREELSKRGKNFYSFEIDWILWNQSQNKKMQESYHLTQTIFY